MSAENSDTDAIRYDLEPLAAAAREWLPAGDWTARTVGSGELSEIIVEGDLGYDVTARIFIRPGTNDDGEPIEVINAAANTMDRDVAKTTEREVPADERDVQSEVMEVGRALRGALNGWLGNKATSAFELYEKLNGGGADLRRAPSFDVDL